MIIRRRPRGSGFTIVATAIIEDPRLSWEAVGLLAYLLGRPDNWSVHINQLVKLKPCGRDRMLRLFKEMIWAGYVEHERKRLGGRIVGGEYTVTDDPSPLLNVALQEPCFPPEAKAVEERILIRELDSPPTPSDAGGEAVRAREEEESRFSAVLVHWRSRRGAYPRRRGESEKVARMAWRRLTAIEQATAAATIGPFFDAFETLGREYPISLKTYLSGRYSDFRAARPEISRPAASAPDLVMVKAFSRGWWCLWWRTRPIARQVASNAAGLALERQLAWTVSKADAPTDEDERGMAAIRIGGAAYQVIMDHLASKRIFDIPRPDKGDSIFAPRKLLEAASVDAGHELGEVTALKEAS